MRNKRAVVIAVCAALALAAGLIWDNTRIVCTEIAVRDSRIPEAFDGYRIAQVSDLHGARFGKDNARLLDVLRRAKPDIIALTGDLMDSDRSDISAIARFAAGAVQIAPTYFVSGNHEAMSARYDELRSALESVGTVVLEDCAVNLERNGETAHLIGLRDMGFYRDQKGLDAKLDAMARTLAELLRGECDIVLSHRPELIDLEGKNVYAGAALVLSGHAHGGQVRLPFLGGLYAPGEGLLPEYDAGLYRCGDTNLIVSRGLGNSVVPIRVNDCPEVVLAVLERNRKTDEAV